jgi:hypothetical protein
MAGSNSKFNFTGRDKLPFPIYVCKGRRPPAWRWEQAVALNSDAKLLSPKQKNKLDATVLELAKYLQAKTAKGTFDVSHTEELKLFYEIDCMHEHSDSTKHRWAIEALIVAGESTDSIHQFTGIEHELIELYEKTFFDIREMVRNPGYIKMQVLGKALLGDLSNGDPDICWKAIAHAGGVEALKNWWELGRMDENWVSYFRSAARSQGAKNLYVAQTGYGVSRFTSRFVVENAIKQQDVEIKAAALGDSSNDEVLKSTSKVLQSMDFTFGGGSDHNDRLAIEGISRIEPRASDQIEAALAAVKIDVKGPTKSSKTQEQPKP